MPAERAAARHSVLVLLLAGPVLLTGCAGAGVVAQLPAGLPHRFGGVCAEGDADCAAEAAEPFGLPGIDPQGVGDEEVRGDGQADGARLELQGGDLGILWVLTCGLRASPSSSFVRF